MLKYNLQYFAKDGPTGEKTEEATPKKKDEARKDGNVAKSQEIVIAVSLLSLFIMMKFLLGTIGNELMETFNMFYQKIPEIVLETSFSINTVSSIITTVLLKILIIIAPMLIIGFVVAFMSNKLQIKWMVTFKPLKPKFNKINPLSGFKRLFSKDKIMELIKSIAKIGIISYIAYITLKDEVENVFLLYDMGLKQALELIGDIIVNLGIKISLLMLVIGFADLIYQRRKQKEDLKMSKQDVKDEFKNSEGDPKIKSQQRARMQEASRRRMMNSVPEADVVITNPTHFAVAIMYKAEEHKAPIVTAKGADYVAQKIKEIAKENNVEIVENKPLARMLYHNVDVDSEIPPELYQSVAEVLAYVYNLKNKI